MSDEWKKRVISIAFTLAVVAIIGLIMAPLPLWTPSPTPTPEPTARPEPTPTARPDVTVCASGCDFTSLQAAMDAAKSGEVIAVLDAIHNLGTVTLERCVITENNTSAGGGLHNFGSMTLTNCTVSNNVADGSGEFYTKCGTGGGIKGEQGPLVLINSTISGNDATGGNGGGLCVRGAAQLTNSTIVHNRAAKTGWLTSLGCWASRSRPLRFGNGSLSATGATSDDEGILNRSLLDSAWAGLQDVALMRAGYGVRR